MSKSNESILKEHTEITERRNYNATRLAELLIRNNESDKKVTQLFDNIVADNHILKTIEDKIIVDNITNAQKHV